jgi:aminoethylphosphonate catabolism LysR family transcriptional regulator
MSINHAHLRAFHAVATEGGFTKAARVIGISQPTLSAEVRALERGYGVVLFDRRGRGVELTDFGRDLLAVTSRLFASATEAEELLSGAREVTTGHLKLGAAGPYQAVPMMAAFARRHPGPHLSLLVGNTRTMLQALLDCRIDLAFLAQEPPDPRLYSLALRTDPVVVIVAAGHPWAKRKSVRLKDLPSETVVLREPGSVTREVVENAIDRVGLSLGHTMEIADWEAMRETVASGLGIGVISVADLGRDARLVALPIRDARLEITEYLVCLKERRRLRIVRAFLDLVG